MCPMNTTAQLQIKTLQHSFEVHKPRPFSAFVNRVFVLQIIFNNQKIADFVHRVDPNLIKSVSSTS